MAGASNYLEDKILNWIKGTAFGTAPAAVYVALMNGDPLDTDAGGTEVTTTIRVAGRLAVTFGSITTNTGANSMANSAQVNFGNSAGTATVDYFKLMDASSGGNQLCSAALAASKSVVAGIAVTFEIGDLVVTCG